MNKYCSGNKSADIFLGRNLTPWNYPAVVIAVRQFTQSFLVYLAPNKQKQSVL